MRTLLLLLVVLCLLPGCAASPEAQAKRHEREAAIQEILSQPTDAEQSGAVQRCLTRNDFRSFSALDERHLLFKGRSNKFWINTLQARCPGLDNANSLIVTNFSLSRVCEKDRFSVSDWFDWPWYRRWPWHWGSGWAGTGTCALGEFQPVSEDQVSRIEAVLEKR